MVHFGTLWLKQVAMCQGDGQACHGWETTYSTHICMNWEGQSHRICTLCLECLARRLPKSSQYWGKSMEFLFTHMCRQTCKPHAQGYIYIYMCWGHSRREKQCWIQKICLFCWTWLMFFKHLFLLCDAWLVCYSNVQTSNAFMSWGSWSLLLSQPCLLLEGCLWWAKKLFMAIPSTIWPHELFAAIFEFHRAYFDEYILGGGPGSVKAFWDRMPPRPIMHQKANWKNRVVPLALHADGVSVSNIRSKGSKMMDTLSWTSLLSSASSRASVFLIWLCDSHFGKKSGRSTTWKVFVLKWTDSILGGTFWRSKTLMLGWMVWVISKEDDHAHQTPTLPPLRQHQCSHMCWQHLFPKQSSERDRAPSSTSH